MFRIERRPRPTWMRSAEFVELADRLSGFNLEGGTRKLQDRFPLAKSLEPFGPDIERALHEQFDGRCAYTEVRAEDVERPLRLVWHRPTNDAAELDGTIDHDHYWWLTLDWGNWYLASAFVESVKSYQFPVAGDRAPVGTPDAPGAPDTGLLLDPCHDEPAWWLRFHAGGHVEPRLPPSEAERERFGFADRGATTIRILGLDSEDLRGRRSAARAELASIGAWGEPGGAIVDEVLDGRWPHRGALLQFVIDDRIERLDQDALRRLAERAPEALGARLFDEQADVPERLGGAPASVLDELADRLVAAFADIRTHPRFATLFGPALAQPTRARQAATGRRTAKRAAAPSVSIGPTDRIQRVLIKDFRAIRQIELSIDSELVDLPPKVDERGVVDETAPTDCTQWKVLLGENGSGKSSILHAIALALAGDRLQEFMAAAGLRWESILRRPDDPDERVQGRVLLEFTGGQRIDLRFTGATAWFHGLRGGAPAMHLNVRAYGATRLLQKSRNRTADVSELLVDLAAAASAADDAAHDRNACLDAVNDASVLVAEIKDRLTVPARSTSLTTIDIGNLLDSAVPVIDAMRWLRELGDDEFNVAALTLSDLLGEPSMVTARPSQPTSAQPGSTQPARRRIERRTEGDATTIYVDDDPLELVSDGYRSVIAVGCDIMQGVGGLDTDRGGHSDLARARGIVLIDEIGAHLHPRWRMQITDRLRRAFPNVQFVATTHEPLCLRGLLEREVVKVSKWERHGVVLHEIERAPARYRVDQLLTSEFFGLDSAIDPEVDAKFRRYYELRRSLRPDEPAGDELRRLDAELNQRLRPVLGYTRRDQLMYEAIDAFLAEEGEIDDPEARQRRRIETVRAVAEQWTKLRRTPG